MIGAASRIPPCESLTHPAALILLDCPVEPGVNGAVTHLSCPGQGEVRRAFCVLVAAGAVLRRGQDRVGACAAARCRKKRP
jgi:hypothetical protein